MGDKNNHLMYTTSMTMDNMPIPHQHAAIFTDTYFEQEPQPCPILMDYTPKNLSAIDVSHSSINQAAQNFLVSDVNMYSSPHTPHVNLYNSNQYMSDQKSYITYKDESPNKLSCHSETKNDGGKHQKADKSSKGLRHFSMKVLQKVEAKKVTTYNEVADELVREFGNHSADPEKQSYDQKNIRRRVYDALNVLMAMNIIHKEKKEIKWVGLPSNDKQESQRLEGLRQQLFQRVEEKAKRLRDLIIQEVCIQRLINENESYQTNAIPSEEEEEHDKLELPFAAVVTGSSNNVDCCVTPQKDEFIFNFESNFDVVDETQILRQMGYCGTLETGTSSNEELSQFKSNLPCSIHPFIDVLGCCSTNEFAPFILNHRSHLINDNIHPVDLSMAHANFYNNLIDSCKTKRFSKHCCDTKETQFKDLGQPHIDPSLPSICLPQEEDTTIE